MPNSLRARFVLWHVILAAATLVVSAFVCHSWLGMALDRHHDHQLLESAERITDSLAKKSLDPVGVADSVRSSGVGSNSTMVLVRNRSGDLVYDSSVTQHSESPGSRDKALVKAAMDAASGPRFLTLTLHESEFVRFVSVPIRPGEGSVQVGIVMGDVSGWLHSLEFWSVILIPLLLALTSLGTWIAAGRGLKPNSPMVPPGARTDSSVGE